MGVHFRAPRTLGGRLLTAQGVVLAASVLTAAAVATVVGPPLFHQHLLESGHPADSPEIVHIEEAYRTASLTSLGVALVVALVCAFVVVWFVARRIQIPLHALSEAAREMAGGHYGVRVAEEGSIIELDSLATSFNSMARQLEHTEDTRRRLLSDLAHELRTPIATMRAYLESVDDGIRSWDADTQRVLSLQVTRLARLAEDLDDVSRAEEGRMPLQLRRSSIHEVVNSAAAEMATQYHQKGVQLLVDTRMPSAHVMVDRDRIAQVIGNLLANALRHTPPNGAVNVKAKATKTRTIVTVTDDGEGIEEGQLTHIFERFYRGDSARDRNERGSGIGLTISRAIVDAHHGTLTATSPGIGQGTVLSMDLPLCN